MSQDPHTPAYELGARFDNAYARLPARLYERVDPTPVAAASLLALNTGLAEDLGLDPARLASSEGVAVLAGNRMAAGAEPLAMAYAGHQFGQWVPQLGDGRAILLGEVIDTQGVRQELQLKGAGRTSFSRGGDGRAWLGPVLREYILSEAMHALGVPTTRALAVVTTGEPVLRESVLPGAIVVRVARSHVRVGTFQYFAARGDVEALQALLDHVVTHHCKALVGAENRALAFLDAVVEAQAQLVARWMSVGFIHGVMNTDNCSVLGDTIDYGPAAFLDEFEPDKVFSSIDAQGRYAWFRQPQMAHWNLGNLAQCLLPLIDSDQQQAVSLAQASVDAFEPVFTTAWNDRLGAKVGLPAGTGAELGRDYLELLRRAGADFTLGFSALTDQQHARTLLAAVSDELDEWWQRRDAVLHSTDTSPRQLAERLTRHNPVRIPRNHRIESVIQSTLAGDTDALPLMMDAMRRPYEADSRFSEFARAPEQDERVRHTFCGT